MSTPPLLGGGALPAKTRRDDGHRVCTPSPPPPATKIVPFGPWSRSPSISPMERVAEFRSFAALSSAFLGSADPLLDTLRKAETGVDAAARALELLDAPQSLTRRRLISTFGAVSWSRRR
jgi:hypothetical protein